MRKFYKSLAYALCLTIFGSFGTAAAGNQTKELTPILSGYDLPYRIQIQQADFSMPNGIHSFASAEYDGKWLFVAGRTNGMHGFSNDDNNFPPQKQNTTIYVVNPATGQAYSRALDAPTSGLTQTQIDTLSVTSPQFYQDNATLYVTGGYGVITATGEFSTKDTLTAIDVPGLMNWVMNAPPSDTAAQHIRQISDPTFQVTGGAMTKIGNNPTMLILGQNFAGFYNSNSNGDYTQQIRLFNIHDDGVNLSATILPPDPIVPDPHYRRRDLNVVPVVKNENGQPVEGMVALSGVFTLNGGAWTVPIVINEDGTSFMPNPHLADTFKQGMNNYTCAVLGAFSEDTGDMYNILLGGITYEYYENGSFQKDSELPFTNQVTTVAIDNEGKFSQYLLDAQYPVILSQFSNPGNQLLFGAGAQLMLPFDVPYYSNGVLKYDELGPEFTTVGYVVGGIQSTLPNTNFKSDSAASPYVFKVMIAPVPVLSGCQVYDVTNNNLGSQAGAVILDCATLKTLNPVDSPTQITIRQGGGTFDTNGYDSTLSGVIWGPGPLNKVGGGILTLTADSSGYTGTTTVAGGILRLAQGSKLGGTLNVERDYLLVGTGTAGSHVNNRGIVAPGNSPGTLYVAGSYTQHHEGILVFELDSTGGSTLQVSGHADISGTLTVYNPTRFIPAIGTIYTPLYAGSISGVFNHTFTNLSPTVRMDTEYFSNGVWLKVVRDYISPSLLPDLTKNETAVGEMLNRVAGGASLDLNSVLSSIDSLQTNQEVAHAYDQLMPRTAAIESEIAFAQATLQVRNLIKRMENISRKCGGIEVNGRYDPCGWFDNLGVFLTATGLFTEQREDDCKIPYDSSTGAFTLGADYYLGNALYAGLYFGYGRTNADIHEHGGNLFINAWQAGIYSSWSYDCFNFDGLFSYGWNNYEIERKIKFANIDRKAVASPDGHQYIAYGSVGYDIDRNGWILEPLVWLQYVSVNIDEYQEREADSLDLKVKSQNATSFQAAAGGILSFPFRCSFARIMPTVRAFYVHEFDDGKRSIKASLAKTPNSHFTIHAGNPTENFTLFGFGLTVLLNPEAIIFLDYDAEFGRRHYNAQSIQGGFRYEF